MVSGQATRPNCDYTLAKTAGTAGFIQTDKPASIDDVSFAGKDQFKTTSITAPGYTPLVGWDPTAPGTAKFNIGANKGAADAGMVLGYERTRRIDSGFEVKFSYQYTGGATTDKLQGFALTVSTVKTIFFSAPAGNKLGYSTATTNGLAIEFDCFADTELRETVAPHITLQSSALTGQLTADASATASASVLSGGALANLCDRTKKDVSVIFSPLTGLTVNIGSTSYPVGIKAGVDVLSAFKSSTGYNPVYFGFTTSFDAGVKTSLEISNIQLATLGADPTQTQVTSTDGKWANAATTPVVLGVNDAVTAFNEANAPSDPPVWMPRVIPRDYCSKSLGIGGAPASFTASLLLNGVVAATTIGRAKQDDKGQWTTAPRGDGSYPIQVWSQKISDTNNKFSLRIVLDGSNTEIPGSPFPITFVAGDISVGTSVAWVGVKPATPFAYDYPSGGVERVFTASAPPTENFKSVYIWAVDKFQNPIPYGQRKYEFSGIVLPLGTDYPSLSRASEVMTDMTSNVYEVKLSYNIVPTDFKLPIFVKLTGIYDATGTTKTTTSQEILGNLANGIPKYRDCTIKAGPISPKATRFDNALRNPVTQEDNLQGVVAGKDSVVWFALYDGVTRTTSDSNPVYPDLPANAAPTPAPSDPGVQFRLTASLLNIDGSTAPVPPIVSTNAAWDSTKKRYKVTFTTQRAGNYKLDVTNTVGSDTQTIANTYRPQTRVGDTSGPTSFLARDQITTVAGTAALGTTVAGELATVFFNANDAFNNTGVAMQSPTYMFCAIYPTASPPPQGTNNAAIVNCVGSGSGTPVPPSAPTQKGTGSSTVPTCVNVVNPASKYKIQFTPFTNGEHSIVCSVSQGTTPSGQVGGFDLGYKLIVNPDGPNGDKSVVVFPSATAVYEVSGPAIGSPALNAEKAYPAAVPIVVSFTLYDKNGNLRAGFDDSQLVFVSLVSVDGTAATQTLTQATPVDVANAKYSYTLTVQNAGQFIVQVEIPRGNVVTTSKGVNLPQTKIYVLPGRVAPATTTGSTPQFPSAVFGVGLTKNGEYVTLAAKDRFQNPVFPPVYGKTKYGDNYAPQPIKVYSGANAIITLTVDGTDPTVWSGKALATETNAQYVCKQDTASATAADTIFTYTPTGLQNPPTTNSAIDLCDGSRSLVAGQPSTFNVIDVAANTDIATVKFSFSTVPATLIFMSQTLTPVAGKAQAYGQGTFVPAAAGTYFVHVYENGAETQPSKTANNNQGYKCTVGAGALSGPRSGLSFSPSVIAGVGIDLTVTFKDFAGNTVSLNDSRINPRNVNMFDVKAAGDTPEKQTGVVLNVADGTGTAAGTVIVRVAFRTAGTAAVVLAYKGTAPVTITSQAQLTVLPNSPASAVVSDDLGSALAVAGLQTTLADVKFKDQFGNDITKQSDLCDGCRVYTTVPRRSNPNLVAFPATVTFGPKISVAFVPTVADYTKLSTVGWYVSGLPSSYTVNSALNPLPIDNNNNNSTGVADCTATLAGVCLEPGSGLTFPAQTTRRIITGTFNILIGPGQAATIKSTPLTADGANNTVVAGGFATTLQAGQTQMFTTVIKDAFGNGWRAVNPGAGGTITYSKGVSISLIRTTATVDTKNTYTPPTPPDTDETGTNAGTGTYRVSVMLTLAGEWTAVVTANGVPVYSLGIKTTTYVTVLAGPAYPPNTVLATPIPGTITAGSTANSVITLRDLYFNPIVLSSTSPKTTVDVKFYFQELVKPTDASQDWQACTASKPNSVAPAPAVIDMLQPVTPAVNTKGAYDITFTPKKVGVYYAWVTLGGEVDPTWTKPAIANPIPVGEITAGRDACSLNPFNFKVIPGPISPPQCTIDGPGIVSARALVNTTFQVTLRDKFDNQIGTSFSYKVNGGTPVAELPTIRSALETIDTCTKDGTNGVTADRVLVPALLNDPKTGQDNGDGTASFRYAPAKSEMNYISVSLSTDFINKKNKEIDANALVVVSDAGTTVNVLGTPKCKSFNVYASFTQTINGTTTTAVATVPNSIDMTGYDASQFKNQVNFGVIGYKMQIRRDPKNNFAIDKLPVASFTAGFSSIYSESQLVALKTQTVKFIPSWQGIYDVIVSQDPTDLTDPQTDRAIAPFIWTMTVTAAKCSQLANGASPYRCGANGGCVTAQNKCPGYVSCPGTAALCGTSCSESCNTPSYPTELQFTQLYGESGDATATCSLAGGVRKSSTDCPTKRQCPVGWIMCGDRYTCASTAAQCPTGITCPPKTYLCPNGRCASRAENCGSDVTCPVGQVLCPDGSCQSSRETCQEILSCNAYTLGNQTMVGCASGTCRGDWQDCPVPRACPPGWTLCANGQCLATAASCNTTTICLPSEHRCGDGTCRQNHLLCPSQVTCPLDQVQCADGECASDVSFCRTPRPCPDTKPYYCPDGSCATGPTACATTKTCPLNTPTLCADGSCAVSVRACVTTTACPSHLDVRCPDGSCRSAVESCPTLVSCPPKAPVRCADGSCAPAPEVCTPPTKLTCDSGAVRCPAGECAPSLSQCPTQVTCPASQQRCVDGTCRTACSDSIIDNALLQCKGTGQLTCPNSHMGIACATSLADCPVSRTCPWSTPVRCADQSCAVTVEECPPSRSLSTSQYGCVSGAIAEGFTQCGTGVTCPKESPVKCWDDTCRIVAEDCPAPPRCPRDTRSNNNSPFMCSDGACVPSLGGCRATTACPQDRPIKCSWYRPVLTTDQLSLAQDYSGTAACVARREDCLNLYTDTLRPTIPTQDNKLRVLPQNYARRGEGATQAQKTLGDCPSGLLQRSRSGACVSSVQYTGKALCPLNAPFQCDGGFCVRGSPVSPQPNDANAQCPNAKNDDCAAGQTRCHDGACVSTPAQCVDETDTFNACPASRPFRCADGFCAISSTRCPILPPSSDDLCPNDKPVRCADGTCQELSIHCSVIKPCYVRYNLDGNPDGGSGGGNVTQRCDDGTCPDFKTRQCGNIQSAIQSSRRCSNTARKYRCPNGLCAVDASQCGDDSSVGQGCPALSATAAKRCGATGFCATCPTTQAVPTNGCAVAGQKKCWDGSCVADLATCTPPTGCPSGKPVLCPNGECALTASACAGGNTCLTGKVRCPSGVCAASYTDCQPTINGCPSTTPVRCADGTCKALRAQFSLATVAFDAAKMCVPTVVCSSREPFMCADGSCVSNTNLCRPVHECTKGTYCIYTGTCLDDDKTCPRPDNIRAKTAPHPICPAANPTLCSDGACRRTPSECHDFRQSLCEINQVRCWDGACESSYTACIARAVLLQRGTQQPLTARKPSQLPTLPSTLTITAALACPVDSGATYVCPNGECVTDRSMCQAISGCPAMFPQRCWDGSCVNGTATDCPAAPGPCEAATRCEDGMCRDGGDCPIAQGCPVNTQNDRSYYCSGLASGPCVRDRDTCNSLLQQPSVCQSDCERDNSVRTTQIALSTGIPRDVTVDVSFSAENVIRTQVIIPAGLIPGGTAPGPRVVTFQSMRYETGRARKLPSNTNNPTEFDKQDVELLSTPFTCSIDGSQDRNTLTNPWIVFGAINREAYNLAGAAVKTTVTDNGLVSEVPCEYQGEFTADGPTPWSSQSENIPRSSGNVQVTATSIKVTLLGATDTLSIAGDLLPFDITDPNTFTKWVPDQAAGKVCMCFNVTRQDQIPAPESVPGYVANAGYNPVTNYQVGSQFCVTMTRTASPKNTIIELLSVVVQPANKYCPATGAAGLRRLTVSHTAATKNSECGQTGQAAAGTAGDNGFIPANQICLAWFNTAIGLWECTEPDETFFDINAVPSAAPFVPYRAWDPTLGLAITRAQGRITVCDSRTSYAFAHFTPPNPPIAPVADCNLWCRYWKVILGVVIGVGVFTCLAAYAIWRLVRYRRKYKEKQEHLRDLKDRAMELDQFHGGLGVDGDDDDIHMMANPLVIEMQDLELQIRKVEQDMNIQGDTERIQIDQLEMERQRLYAEIQRVKEAMQKQNVSGPTGPSRAEAAPAALGGYGHQQAALPGQMGMGQGTSQQRLVPNNQQDSTIHHEFGQVRRPAKKKDF